MNTTPVIQARKPLADNFPIIVVSLTPKHEGAVTDSDQPIIGSWPVDGRAGYGIKYPFRNLKVGEGFYAPVGTRESIITSKKRYQKLTGFLFITRKQPDGRIFVLRVS